MNYPGRLILVSALCLPALICSAVKTPDEEYESVAEEYIRGYLAARPLLGTSLGLHEYDGKISDFSRLALDAELSRLRRFDDRLSKFDLTKLSGRQSIDLRILQAAIRKELFQRQELFAFEKDPTVYAKAAPLNVYIQRNFAALDDRARSVVAIESQIPNIIIAAKTNLAPVLPRPHVELAIQIARGSADFLRRNLTAAFEGVKDERIQAEFDDANRKAATALGEYASWLERERLPKATPEFAIGEEKLHRFLADTELVDIPPSKILEMGLAKLKQEQIAFAEAAKQIDPNKSPMEVFREIQKEHAAPENLIHDVAGNLENIRKFVVSHHLIAISSEVRAQVKETPQYRRATSFASMDTPGPFEKRAPEAYFYVTPVENDWSPLQKEEWLSAFNNYTADLVAIHEAYPGHYVQFLRLNASGATKVEKIFGTYGFVEGWAHYCEQMMIEQGYGASPAPMPTASPSKRGSPSPTPTPLPAEEVQRRAAKYRMAQSDEALLRWCRLCVAIKLHTQNMSIEQATQFFRDNCYYEEKPARAEAMRGTVDPGYLNYSLGKLQILKLLKDYKAQQGNDFSLEKFHNELLNHGMPPIRLLRELMLKDKAKWNDVLSD
jgi:uncharacterized protein (DUF885 family)